jgi:hypothetical protein
MIAIRHHRVPQLVQLPALAPNALILIGTAVQQLGKQPMAKAGSSVI